MSSDVLTQPVRGADLCSRRMLYGIGLGLVALIYVYPLTLDIPLLDPDEGMHASIAQEMVEGGDYTTPRLFGQPFYDKPILFFWIQAASLKLFGMNEFAVRLPGLLFGLLGNATTALLAGRVLGARVGMLAGLLHATMVLPIALCQAAVHDVALVPWTNLAMLSFWEMRFAHTTRRSFLAVLSAGALLGLAILTKGLIGVALVCASFGLFLLWLDRLGGWRFRWALVAAFGLGLVMASPWYLAMEWSNPGYLYYYFVERHLLGYVTATQVHGDEPWWYYAPIFLGGALPWVAYLPVAAREGWLHRKEPTSPQRQFVLLTWIWLAFSLIFLSTAHSKMVTYILPVFPAAAILAAVIWWRFIEGALGDTSRRMMHWLLWGTCLLGPAVLPVTMLVVQRKFQLTFAILVWGLALAVSAGAWMPLVALRRQWVAGAFASALFFLATTFAIIMSVIVPKIAPATSAKTLAQYFNARGDVPGQVLLLEERIGSLVFYLDPRLRDELGAQQIKNIYIIEALHLDPPYQDVVIALPDKRVRKAREWIAFDGAPGLRVGRHQIFPAGELVKRSKSSVAQRNSGSIVQ
jgi:4-amino-4-deoxy-L-arabinose transferase-like glycosyltransferase